MKAFNALKQLYIMGGGQGDIDAIQENKLANMHSIVYGDGINVELPSDFEDAISDLLENGVGVVNFNEMKTYYATEPLQNDPDFSSDEWENHAQYGLSTTMGGNPLTYNELVSEFNDDLSINDNVKIFIPSENKYMFTGVQVTNNSSLAKLAGYTGWNKNTRPFFGAYLRSKQESETQL